MKHAVQEVFTGFRSLLTGLRITLQHFFKPSVTVQYPHESIKMQDRFRGPVKLVRVPDSDKSLCVACDLCVKACPSFCIIVEGIRKEGEKRKSPTKFTLDYNQCSLCGACVEICPTDALCYSRDYNLASTSKESFHYDLLKKLQAEQK